MPVKIDSGRVFLPALPRHTGISRSLRPKILGQQSVESIRPARVVVVVVVVVV